MYLCVGDVFLVELFFIEMFVDGDEKEYVVRVLVYLDDEWLVGYCVCEVLVIDIVNNVCKELLCIFLEKFESLVDGFCWFIGF